MDSVKEEKKARKQAKRKHSPQAGICSIATPLIVVYAEGHSLKQARKTAFDAVREFAGRMPERKEVD